MNGVDMSTWPREPEPPFDFYQMLEAQVEAIREDLTDWKLVDIQVHAAVEEYLRWYNEQPMMYATIGEMPAEVALGFEHLIRKLGKELVVTAAAVHERLARMSEQRARVEHQMMFG
jgi:hypothetical protein